MSWAANGDININDIDSNLIDKDIVLEFIEYDSKLMSKIYTK